MKKEDKRYLRRKIREDRFFNVKESAYILGGGLIGGALQIPLVYIGSNVASELITKSEGDLISLGTAILISLPFGLYGAYNGAKKGFKSAMIAKGKRQRISKLENNLE